MMRVAESSTRSAPRLMWITDGQGDPDRILTIAAAAVRGGMEAIQVREPGMAQASRRDLLRRLVAMLRPLDCRVMVNDDLLQTDVCDGLHLKAGTCSPRDTRQRVGGQPLLSIACHDPQQLRVAGDGCDFALLSPVWPTRSKPGHPGIGLPVAAEWTRQATVPVLWLGGVAADRILGLQELPEGSRPAGLAVMGEIAHAADPERAARQLSGALLDGPR
jgi:thiamine-phosphate pyrophosphorylase